MPFQVNALEQDALEVLSIVRSFKNSLAPVNRIPPEVLSLIPDYCEEHHTYQDTIRLTHVCRGWRDIFTSRPSLWTNLDCTDVDKTRTFIQRSKSSPLDICARNIDDETYLDDALSLVIPHVPRLRSLSFYSDAIPDTLRNFSCHTPLLEDLEIHISSPDTHTLDIPLLNGDLPSLRNLSLSADTIRLPQKNTSNLRVFNLSCARGGVTVTQILDFLESSPLLQKIGIVDSIPDSSDAPPERIVPLRHVETLSITADTANYIFKHLRIPFGASLRIWAAFRGEASPLLEYFRGTSPNTGNLSCITAANFCFEPNVKRAKLSGPSGSFCLSGWWDSLTIPSTTMDDRIIHSVGPRILSTTERLMISDYLRHDITNIEQWPIFQTLLSTKNLQTLVLSRCENRLFISALNPEKNSSGIVLCPGLKKFTLFVESWGLTNDVVDMAKKRALRGAKLSSITIVSFGAPVPETDVLELGEHITQVECTVETMMSPSWEYLPQETRNG